MKTGLFVDILMMAVDSIRSNKMRTFLTVLGVVIGVLTIVAMVAVIEGINGSFAKEIESMGANVLFVSKYEPGINVGRPSEEIRRRKKLTVADAEAIAANCESISAVTPELQFFRFLPPVKVKYLGREVENPQVYGDNHLYLQIYESYSIDQGRFFTEAENRSRAEVCVIGAELVDALFPNGNPIGKEVQLDGRTMTVIGTFARLGKFMGEARDNYFMMPSETFQKFYPGERNVFIMAKVRPGFTMERAKDEIVNLMRVRRKVRPGQPNDFAVFTQETIQGLFSKLTGAAFIVMLVISSIGLLVGGIGVMNIMLVSVKERTREIGLRKAIGAKGREIRNQFLYESMILTLGGGIIGIVLGVAISFLIRIASGLPTQVNPLSIVIALGVSTGVGLFFGIYPAAQAAKLQPVESLRYE
ncbi:MAG TPA: ABC transporter permease [Candidatus Aminicenantes bacterium]|nr:ABC transporter permease [Candidatus Aminicenantes bacterium]